MSDTPKESDRSPGDPAEKSVFDTTYFTNLDLMGVIAFGGTDDKFFYYPLAGFVEGQSIHDLAPFDLNGDNITSDNRQHQQKFQYVDGGDYYPIRIFARVAHGMDHFFVTLMTLYC